MAAEQTHCGHLDKNMNVNMVEVCSEDKDKLKTVQWGIFAFTVVRQMGCGGGGGGWGLGAAIHLPL